MKFLLSLIPPSPQNNLLDAFLDLLEAFLIKCNDLLPGLLATSTPLCYQPEYDSDEETFDVGQNNYEAMLRMSQSKVRQPISVVQSAALL